MDLETGALDLCVCLYFPIKQTFFSLFHSCHDPHRGTFEGHGLSTGHKDLCKTFFEDINSEPVWIWKPSYLRCGCKIKRAYDLVDWGGLNNNSGVVTNAKEVLEAARTNLTNILHSVSIAVLFQSWGTTDPSIEVRYESSNLIRYKELSSPIFQSLWVSESKGIGNTCPDLHFVQYIKA